MKDVARCALLLDHYGALLTEKQREIYEWYYQQDLSLGEISEIANVSRNAVHDLISRTDEKLERFESALGLVSSGKKQEREAIELTAFFNQWLAEHGEALDAGAKGELEHLIGRLLQIGDD